jgi:hypothetical protein
VVGEGVIENERQCKKEMYEMDKWVKYVERD